MRATTRPSVLSLLIQAAMSFVVLTIFLSLGIMMFANVMDAPLVNIMTGIACAFPVTLAFFHFYNVIGKLPA